MFDQLLVTKCRIEFSIHATEDKDVIHNAIVTLFPLDYQKYFLGLLEVIPLEGYHKNPILLNVIVSGKKRLNRIQMEYLIKRITPVPSVEELLQRLSEEPVALHLRVNKQSLVREKSVNLDTGSDVVKMIYQIGQQGKIENFSLKVKEYFGYLLSLVGRNN